MATTSERLAIMETKVTDIDNKLDNHICEQRQDFDKVLSKLDDLDKKFAGKWVEKVSIGLLISIFASIITYIFMAI